MLLISMIYDFSYRAEYLKTYEEFIHRPSCPMTERCPSKRGMTAIMNLSSMMSAFSYPGSEEEVNKPYQHETKYRRKGGCGRTKRCRKTTLLKPCAACMSYGRVITLNGIDIRKYNYKEYVKVFSVVFQDFGIFSLPLDENVAAGGAVKEMRQGGARQG